MSVAFSELLSSTHGVSPSGLHLHNSVSWDDQIYILNGKNKKGVFEDKLYVYNVTNMQWGLVGTESLKKPSPRIGASVIVRRDSMITFGGESSNGELLNDLWEFNFKSQTWINLSPSGGPTPGPRSLHCAVYRSTDDSMYILFGRLKNGLSADLYRFSFQENKWFTPQFSHARAPCERESSAAVLSNDQKHIFIFGGNSQKGKHDDFYKLNLESMQWDEIQTTPTLHLSQQADKESSPLTPQQSSANAVSTSVIASLVHSPPKMSGHVMFCDRDHVVIHGGSFASACLYDFVIQDNIWRKVTIQGHHLFGREGHSICNMPRAGQFLVYGGYREDMNRGGDERVQIGSQLESIQLFQFKHQEQYPKQYQLAKMRQRSQLIDVIFVIEGKSFEAHRIVVSRSPQIARMISDQVAKLPKGSAPIINMSNIVQAQVFSHFLKWLYENQLEPDLSTVVDLCKFAREYSIYDLVLACVRFFKQSINSKNIIRLYIEVEKKQEQVLKLLCQQYIFEHFTKVMADANNVAMLSQQHSLLQEVMLLSRDKTPPEVIEKFPEFKGVPESSYMMFDEYLKVKPAACPPDFKLVSQKDSREFYVHKAVFAAQSGVFLNMIKENESTASIDCRGGILEKIVSFVYGTLEVSERNGFGVAQLREIARVGHEWVPSVEDYAIEGLLQRVCKENVLEMLLTCRDLKRLENIDLLKQVCKVEMSKSFTMHELATMIAELVVSGVK